MEYKYHNGKMLRCGYTTGSCAAAASGAAVQMLLSGKICDRISLLTPKGVVLELAVENPYICDEYAECAVRKDGGDDTDATHELLIFSRVKKTDDGIIIDGGKGVGRVTKAGLDQPVGNAAINSVPRKMITEEVTKACEKYGYIDGISVEIYVPDGEETALKTYNPRMGIEGGISIIGTSGIVEPMSVEALTETIRLEMKMRRSEGVKSIVISPGNYGIEYLGEISPDIVGKSVKCSNYIGCAIDYAAEYGFENVLLVGHIGKLVKLGCGIMNTHSAEADGRMETLLTCALLADTPNEVLKKITECVTTDAALDILEKCGTMRKTMEILMGKIDFYIRNRARGIINIGAVTFSNVYGFLGKTADADNILEKIKEQN